MGLVAAESLSRGLVTDSQRDFLLDLRVIKLIKRIGN